MDSAEVVRRRSSALRWRQGAINLALAVAAGLGLAHWEPNFLVLGLFPFGVLRLVQGIELRLGLALGGWTDIPFTPPVIGCWAASSVHLQRLLAGGPARDAALLAGWLALGLLLYVVGRWLQMRYYARYLARGQHSGEDQ